MGLTRKTWLALYTLDTLRPYSAYQSGASIINEYKAKIKFVKFSQLLLENNWSVLQQDAPLIAHQQKCK